MCSAPRSLLPNSHAQTQVLVDVNWRPVFWDDHDTAPQRIRDYVNRADILKLSDDEAEYIYGVGHRVALDNPEVVCLPCCCLL